MADAARMLEVHVKAVKEYLIAVKEGKTPFDQAKMRAIAVFCDAIQILRSSSETLGDSASKQRNDILILSVIAAATKAISELPSITK